MANNIPRTFFILTLCFRRVNPYLLIYSYTYSDNIKSL